MQTEMNSCCVLSAGTTSHSSIKQWVKHFTEETNHLCSTCLPPIYMNSQFQFPLPLIAFDFSGHSPNIDRTLSISINGTRNEYILRGITHFGNEHFTSQIISQTGISWFHDGIITKEQMINEGQVDDMESSLNKCREQDACMAIYTLQQ
jgi:hypothetical protein